jgi:hypothetical protein
MGRAKAPVLPEPVSANPITVEPGKIDYETIFKSKLKLCTPKKMHFLRS